MCICHFDGLTVRCGCVRMRVCELGCSVIAKVVEQGSGYSNGLGVVGSGGAVQSSAIHHRRHHVAAIDRRDSIRAVVEWLVAVVVDCFV